MPSVKTRLCKAGSLQMGMNTPKFIPFAGYIQETPIFDAVTPFHLARARKILLKRRSMSTT